MQIRERNEPLAARSHVLGNFSRARKKKEIALSLACPSVETPDISGRGKSQRNLYYETFHVLIQSSRCNDDVNGINLVSKTKYPFISQKNVVSWNENTSLVFARFFVEKRFSLELWIIPTRASTVFQQNNPCSPGRFYHLLGEESFVVDRAYDIFDLLGCFVYTREVGKSFEYAL